MCQAVVIWFVVDVEYSGMHRTDTKVTLLYHSAVRGWTPCERLRQRDARARSDRKPCCTMTPERMSASIVLSLLY